MLIFESSRPQELLGAIKDAITANKIVTWKFDLDGDFTHTTDQWMYRAWLHPEVTANSLELTIIPPKNITISSEVYAIYHGRFLESVLAHCDSFFSSCKATALPAGKDRIKVG